MVTLTLNEDVAGDIPPHTLHTRSAERCWTRQRVLAGQFVPVRLRWPKCRFVFHTANKLVSAAPTQTPSHYAHFSFTERLICSGDVLTATVLRSWPKRAQLEVRCNTVLQCSQFNPFRSLITQYYTLKMSFYLHISLKIKLVMSKYIASSII